MNVHHRAVANGRAVKNLAIWIEGQVGEIAQAPDQAARHKEEEAFQAELASEGFTYETHILAPGFEHRLSLWIEDQGNVRRLHARAPTFEDCCLTWARFARAAVPTTEEVCRLFREATSSSYGTRNQAAEDLADWGLGVLHRLQLAADNIARSGSYGDANATLYDHWVAESRAELLDLLPKE